MTLNGSSNEVINNRYTNIFFFLHYFLSLIAIMSLELASLEGLAKLPIGWCHIEACHSSAITGGDLKREGLSIEV